MQFIKYQLNLFFLALGFFSRLPIPNWVTYSSDKLNKANRYFTLVGWLLGGILSLFYLLFSLLFAVDIAVWLTLIVSLLLTGVFHEDGLADTADGFGGGFEKDKKLQIMKDSRLGTYGAAALFVVLTGRLLLWENLAQQLVYIIPCVYAISRAFAASYLFDTKYVTETGSKSKPLAQQQNIYELLCNLICVVPVLLFLSLPALLFILLALLIFRVIYKRILINQIGGFTGDNLGAAQQISELICYLAIIASVSFSMQNTNMMSIL
ncbi:adenosylcobinamide-GDP ribazoletransferase [Catenovulum sediminis]|uniref:Adenosylcobinamide-GDP ribazoletransferase n=1 Tax=Catenovulum sediminis TaxID=1740262 RepID=A0ABV1RJ01_9ALTE|nr:adenosylcobinamide-GDP ribazoletransferase [Catenovulum sediminis]